MNKLTALVAGSTGATGRYIVHELLENDEIEKVTAITRKPIPDPKEYFKSNKITKLEIISFEDNLGEFNWQDKELSKRPSSPIFETKQYKDQKASYLESKHIDLAFCALGSSPHTLESDLYIPIRFLRYSLQYQCKLVTLISSMGANKGSFFGYPRVIGEREHAFKLEILKQPFPKDKSDHYSQLLIVRPGLLLRGPEVIRTAEWIASYITPRKLSIRVEDLAKVAVKEAISLYKERTKDVDQSTWGSFNDKRIHTYEQQDLLDKLSLSNP